MRAPILLLAWLWALLVPAQVDSLQRALNAAPQDSSRFPILTELIRALVFSVPDSGLIYARQYAEQADRLGNVFHKAKGENFIGMCYSVKGEHAEALTHYMRALDGFQRAGDRWYTAMSHNNIGSVHLTQKRLNDARTRFQEAFDGFTAVKDTAWMANTANNLANVFRAEGLLDSAYTYYARAADALERIGDREHAASARYNQGNVRLDQDRSADALSLLMRAEELLTGVEDDQTWSMIHVEKGAALARLKRFDEAEQEMRTALRMAAQGGFKKERADAHENLSDLFERMGRADSALVHLKSFRQWSDSVFTDENNALIADLQERYESGRKDALIAENRSQLERREWTIKAIAAASVLLLLVALFAFRAYRVKRKGEAELGKKNAIIEAQLEEKELLVREIHHRVKNNLQMVSSLLSIQGRGITDEKAKEAVNDSRLRVKSMALIHQDLYREGDLTGVRMKEYVEKLVTGLVSSYAMSERVRVLLAVEDLSLDVDTAVPIGLVLNELVTNALKYAWPDERPGALRVSMSRIEETLEFVVADDGVGTAAGASITEGGFGLNMVKTFAAKLKAEHAISHQNGTHVHLLIRNFKLAR